jgi:hypothetical protein
MHEFPIECLLKNYKGFLPKEKAETEEKKKMFSKSASFKNESRNGKLR